MIAKLIKLCQKSNAASWCVTAAGIALIVFIALV